MNSGIVDEHVAPISEIRESVAAFFRSPGGSVEWMSNLTQQGWSHQLGSFT